MTDRTMNSVIHAAIRRDLARFVAALADFPAGSQHRADQLWAAWHNYDKQLHNHHHDEETIFFPTLVQLGLSEALVRDLDSEHENMSEALAATAGAMGALVREPSAVAAAAALEEMRVLKALTEDHLAHEERKVEPLAAAYRTSPPMKKALNRARREHRANVGTFAAWLQDGIDPDTKRLLRTVAPLPLLYAATWFGGGDYRRRVAPVWS